MNSPEPKLPSELDPLAVELLERLREFPRNAASIVLGGYFALKHYVDFRTTHDVDAWWRQESTSGERSETIEVLREIMREIAARRGLEFSERSSRGEVCSLEFSGGNGRKERRFSFQIAPRSHELTPPLTDRSPWAPIPLESFSDNIASKMTALVDRGAPRDFQDIYTIVSRQLVSVDEAWSFWQQKHRNDSIDEAKANVLKHIASIELRRPLEIVPSGLRSSVAELRRWVCEALCGSILSSLSESAQNGEVDVETNAGVAEGDRRA